MVQKLDIEGPLQACLKVEGCKAITNPLPAGVMHAPRDQREMDWHVTLLVNHNVDGIAHDQ